jgi:hypothetical protein
MVCSSRCQLGGVRVHCPEDNKIDLTTLQLPKTEFGGRAGSHIDMMYGDILINAGEVRQNYNILILEEKCFDTKKKIEQCTLDAFSQGLSDIDQKYLIKYYRDLYKGIGINLTTNRKHYRKIITKNGVVPYERYVLRPTTKDDLEILKKTENRTTVVPLDEWLKIADLPFKITPAAMLDIARCAITRLCYKEATLEIREKMKTEIAVETVHKVTDFIGSIVNDHEIKSAEKIYELFFNNKIIEKNNIIGDTLYIMIDGSLLRTREKDEKRLKWRENKLGAIISSRNMKQKRKDTDKLNFDINKIEYITYFGAVEIFKKLLLAAILRNGYGQHKETVLISDGATWIANLKDFIMPEATHILDFWHLVEHLYEFAKIYFRHGDKKYKLWVHNKKEQLLASEYLTVIEEIKKMEEKIQTNKYKGLNREEIQNVGKLSAYMATRTHNIDYKAYRERGLYMGSGIIESGNKIVAQERLKRPGMMWNINNAQHMLILRAKYKSMLWINDVENIVLNHFKLL